jgi:hypothetical protein
MVAPEGHDVFANMISPQGSWPEKLVDADTESFGEEETMNRSRHGALSFDVRENVPRDVALENLKFCHERVLRPTLRESQFGNLPSDKICSVSHNIVCPSYDFLLPLRCSSYTCPY